MGGPAAPFKAHYQLLFQGLVLECRSLPKHSICLVAGEISHCADPTAHHTPCFFYKLHMLPGVQSGHSVVQSGGWVIIS
jgi:hypothetical protein